VFGLEFHTLCFAPQLLNIVILTAFGGEYVNDNVAVIQQNPATFLIAFDSDAMIAQFTFKRVIDIIADGVQVSPTSATGDQDEVVKNGSHLSHVKDYDVLPPVLEGNLSSGKSTLQA